jgi:streptomycin 6-kinase
MADELDHYRQLLMDDRRETHALAAEARAALAQPEPQGPSEKEWDELRAHFERILCDARSSGGPVVGNIALADHLINAMYARFGPHCALPLPQQQEQP